MLRALANDLKDEIVRQYKTIGVSIAVILTMLFISVVVGAYLGFPTAIVFLGGYFTPHVLRVVRND